MKKSTNLSIYFFSICTYRSVKIKKNAISIFALFYALEPNFRFISKWKLFRDFHQILLEIRTYRLISIIFLFLYSSLYIFQYSSFSLVSKSTNIFRLFHHNRCNPYRKSIKMIFPDVFRESIMWLSGELLHEWLFTRDSIVWIRLSWKNDLLSYVTKSPAVEIQIMRIFSHPRAEIYEINTSSPLCTSLPLLRKDSPPIIGKILARERMTLDSFWKKIRNLRSRITKMRYHL